MICYANQPVWLEYREQREGGEDLREVDRAQILQGTVVYGKDLGFYSIRGFGVVKSDQHVVSSRPVVFYLGYF